MILRAVIDVDGGNIQNGTNGFLVHVRAHGAAEVGGHELAGPSILADQRGLPGQKLGHAHLLPAGPLQLIAGALRAVARGQVFPGIYILAPVVKEPRLVKVCSGPEFLPQVVHEAYKNTVVRGAVGGSLIVNLPPNHRRVVFVVLHKVANHPLSIKPVNRAIRIHVLAHAVERLAATQRPGQHFWMRVIQPGRESSRWGFP